MPNQKFPLLVSPDLNQAEIIHLTPQDAGWDYLHVSVRRMHSGQSWEFDTAENELALVVLGGVGSVESNRGSYPHIGRRPDVFSGMPYSLYLPRRTRFYRPGRQPGVGNCLRLVPDQPGPPAPPGHSTRGGG